MTQISSLGTEELGGEQQASLAITIDANNQTRFEATGGHEQVAQMLALLQAAPSTTAVEAGPVAEVKPGPSKTESFIARRAGALILASVCAVSGGAAYSFTSGHNLFKHPSDISRPIHDVKRVVDLLQAI